MNKQVITFFATFVLTFAPAIAQQSPSPLTQPSQAQSPSTTQIQPTQAQVQACLAALPPAPKPPRPQINLFPGIQKKFDDMMIKAGADPVAMRAAGAQAALEKFEAAKAEYERKRAACSAPITVPVTFPILFPPFPIVPAATAQPSVPQQQPK